MKTLKRYASHKLFDSEQGRYVSFEELASWIRQGQQVRVLDDASGEDVTVATLAEIIAEESRPPSSELVADLIRRGGELVTSGMEQVGQGVDRLLRAGAERLAPLRELRDETLALRQRLEELEAALSRVEASRRTATNGPAPSEPRGAQP